MRRLTTAEGSAYDRCVPYIPAWGCRVAGGWNPPERKDEGLPELPAPGAAPSPGDQTLASLLGERYRAVGRLGAGAFGEVYRAHDTVLGRDVAVKRIRLDAFAEPAQLAEVQRRFVREAQVAARLRHANIVTIHDIVATGATSLIVMELVEGETLQSRLRARGRLDLAGDDPPAGAGRPPPSTTRTRTRWSIGT